MSQKYVVRSPDWPSPQGILLCTALRTGETLRADEIVIEVADRRPASILVNATPLRAIKSSTASLLHEAATLDAGELLRRMCVIDAPVTISKEGGGSSNAEALVPLVFRELSQRDGTHASAGESSGTCIDRYEHEGPTRTRLDKPTDGPSKLLAVSSSRLLLVLLANT